MLTKYLNYAKYLLTHKWFVFIECCKLGIPVKGLLHDLSKLRLSEFIPYANYFGGSIKKDSGGVGYFKPADTGDARFEAAWLLHLKRNPHHWQWWITPLTSTTAKVLEMPPDVRKEMLADWRGAGKAQGTPDTLKWYLANKDSLVLGPETRKWIEAQLNVEQPASKLH